MHHQEQRKEKQATVVSLDSYRERRNKRLPTIEIQLQPGGNVMYSAPDINSDNAFQALIGCYVVAGKLLQTLRESMKCGNGENCGTRE